LFKDVQGIGVYFLKISYGRIFACKARKNRAFRGFRPSVFTDGPKGNCRAIPPAPAIRVVWASSDFTKQNRDQPLARKKAYSLKTGRLIRITRRWKVNAGALKDVEVPMRFAVSCAMMRKVLCACFFVTALLCGCGGARQGRDTADGRLEVVATLFPLYDFAREAGGDKADIRMLIPPGTEAHSFEPAPQDVLAVSRADVFIYTTPAMEPWAEDFLSGVQNPALRVVEAGKGLDSGLGGEDVRESEHQPETHHGEKDPHLWLNLAYAQEMVRVIAEAFAGAKPADRDYFLDRAKSFEARLADLDARIFRAVKGFRRKTIICAGHFAFGYFARRYGLDYLSLYPGAGPNAEMTPRRLLNLTEALKETGIPYIFYEEMAEPRAAEIISRETGARLLLLHGAHSVSKEEFESGIKFLDIMERNLINLQTALGG
jgi:zinc transport system substrate-binding protein